MKRADSRHHASPASFRSVALRVLDGMSHSLFRQRAERGARRRGRSGRALFVLMHFGAALALVTASLADTPRHRPGEASAPDVSAIYEAIAELGDGPEFLPVPDRWRMFYQGKWWDPYNQNVLKGDIPVFGSPGHEWFFELTLLSDSLFEIHNIPFPVGLQSTKDPQRNNAFGDGEQFVFVENFLTSFSLIRGNTTFMPPEYEFRVTPVFQANYVDVREDGGLRADPARGDTRGDAHMGFQELFVDLHLVNLSTRYDFISTRVGIQKFNADFRGFLYSDEQPGVRLFGNYDNNKWQGNLAWFYRLDKDTNSGLNTVFDARDEQVVVANLYRQDAPFLGHTLQLSLVHREDVAGSEGDHYDRNGFLVRPAIIGDGRPKNLYSTYIGLNGDGHFGRINSSASFYYVTGSETHNPIAGQRVDIDAQMGALELSYDIDWIRLRSSIFWGSGDRDPFDDEAGGFDAIFDLPNFAGGDLSFWQRQGIPFIGGGGVFLTNRNSLLASLRAGKEEGQSNFVNPGIRVYNLGLDVEVTPRLKLITNGSFLQFDKTEVIEALRQDGSISRNIGLDLSAGLLYRPFLNNNVQFRLGAAALVPGAGTKNLFRDEVLYTVFSNAIFLY